MGNRSVVDHCSCLPSYLTASPPAEHEEVLTSLARDGLIPLDGRGKDDPSVAWAHLRRILLWRLRSAIVDSYLPKGPSAILDTRVEPRGGSAGWLWGEEEVKREFSRIVDALDDFEESAAPDADAEERSLAFAAAPFTIQRLAELVLPVPPSPHPHYSTLPKFLRAVLRVLSVTSAVSAFSPGSPDADDPAASMGHVNGLDATPSPSPSPSASPALRSRRASSLTPFPSLLEPIPWLSGQTTDPAAHEPTAGPPDGAAPETAADSGLAAASRPLSPPSTASALAPASAPLLSRALSPDAPGAGGRVDEVDAGLGTAQELPDGEAPVAIAGEPLVPSPQMSGMRASASPSPGPEMSLPVASPPPASGLGEGSVDVPAEDRMDVS